MNVNISLGLPLGGFISINDVQSREDVDLALGYVSSLIRFNATAPAAQEAEGEVVEHVGKEESVRRAAKKIERIIGEDDVRQLPLPLDATTESGEFPPFGGIATPPPAPDLKPVLDAIAQQVFPAKADATPADATRALVTAKGIEAAAKLLAGFGVKRVNEIPQERYAEFVAAAQAKAAE